MARKTDPAIRARRERVKVLLVSGLGQFEIARQIVTEGFVRANEGESVDKTIARAYSSVRHDVMQLAKGLSQRTAEAVEEVAYLYIEQQRAIYRELIIIGADRHTKNTFARIAALSQASVVAERIAVVQAINTRPKFKTDDGGEFDPSEDAAESVVRRQRDREKRLLLLESSVDVSTITVTPED